MKCPACQFEQPEDRTDCECCGLIFAKWRARHAPAPAVEEKPAPLESAAPPAPVEAGEAVSIGGTRFYHRLAAMDFQQGPGGERLYFPWGSFGRGFQGMDPGTEKEIERFESLFACVHCPALVLLWMVALLLWLYVPRMENQGLIFFGLYVAGAYGWFGWRSRRWVSRLSPWPQSFDPGQYMKSFASVLNWRFLLDFEVWSLFTLAAGVWLWLSGKFLLLFEDGLLVQRGWLLLASGFWAGSTYFYYFRKK